MNTQDFIGLEEGQVNVIIGENGSGKSTLLSELAREITYQGRQVIAIANSIHDKFQSRSKYFHLLGYRSGKNVSQRTIKKALIKLHNKDPVVKKRIGQILNYVGYQNVIGFKINILKHISPYEIEELTSLDSQESYELSRIIELVHKIKGDMRNNFLWYMFDELSTNELGHPLDLIGLLYYEKLLKKLGVISTIEVFLMKDNAPISLLEASSGELSFITSLVFIATVIEGNSVILIDEPENSLHPRWQREYIAKLMDIFYLHQPTVVCATHSPIVVSGAEVSEQSLSIFKSQNNQLEKLPQNSNNLEQLLWEMFGIATPENRYLSNLITNTLNELAENQIDLAQAQRLFNLLENEVYDPKQKDVLASVRKLADKIEQRKV